MSNTQHAKETAVEDLSYEHGVVNRLMRIYETVIVGDLPLDIFIDVVNINTGIFKEVVENHHEKQEELYVFPIIKDKRYVGQLIADHRRSAKLTSNILQLASAQDENKITQNIRELVNMYRNHTIIEDTLAFPQFRKSISARDYYEISKLMDQDEPDMGPILKTLKTLEAILQIDNY